MSMLDGVSQCWPLAKDCVVWWDAWAAIGAMAGAGIAVVAILISVGAIAATIFLGFMTLGLGRAANEASNTAIGIARADSERQKYRDETERLLVLVQIAGEVSQAVDRVSEAIYELSSAQSRAQFIARETYRNEIFERLAVIKLPVCEGVNDRLHYLNRIVSSKLVRAIGMVRMTQEDAPSWVLPGSTLQPEVAHGMLAINLILIKKDLVEVSGACQIAVQDVGIYQPDIAREVEEFGARVNRV